jgi:hypothetical protein
MISSPDTTEVLRCMNALLTPQDNTPAAWLQNAAGFLAEHQEHLVGTMLAQAHAEATRRRVESATRMMISVSGSCFILTGLLTLNDPAALLIGTAGTVILVGLFGAYRLLVGWLPLIGHQRRLGMPVICRVEGEIERVWWPVGDSRSYGICLGTHVWMVSQALWESIIEHDHCTAYYLLQGGTLLSIQPSPSATAAHDRPCQITA